jgi:polyferredoxin
MADASGASQDKTTRDRTAKPTGRKRKADPRQVITTGVRVAFLAIFLFLVLNGKMPVWLGLFALSLVGATFFGRFFCGYACPMNTLMVPTDWLAKKLRLARRPAPAWLKGRYLPWVVLVVSLVSMMGLKRALGLDIPILLVLTGVAVVITLFYEPEVFHNRICPFGMLQKIGGRFARFSKTVDQDACVGCGLCVKACDSAAVQVRNRKAAINPAMCHQCQNCTVACPKNAIAYGRAR